MCGWMCGCVGGCVDVWVDVVYHPPSIITLTHSLTRSLRSFVCSFVASPVQSYGVNAGVVFCRGVCAPYWFIERSCDASLASFGFRRTRSAVGGRYPLKSYGGGARVCFMGGLPPLWSIERSCDALLASFGESRTRSRRLVAEPPYWFIEHRSAVGGRYPRGTPQTIPRDHNTV